MGSNDESDDKDDSDNKLTYIVKEIQQRKVGHIQGKAWIDLQSEVRQMWRNMNKD